MRPVPLTPAPGEDKALLKWCKETIEQICRASQVDTAVTKDKQNSGKFLAKAANLSDVDNAQTAFDNIKQDASESYKGVVELATDAETISGSSDTLGTHPKGVAAAIGAAVTALLDGVDSAFDTLKKLADGLATKLTAADNLSDVANAATAFGNIKQAATTDATGVVEKATEGEVAAATADKYIAADHLASASASVALTDAAPVAVDWTAAAANYSLTVTADRQIGNPTNGIPGTWRTILVQASSSTERTITFGNQFGGEVPEITDVTNTKWYEIIIRCVTATHFLASARDASPPSP